MTTTGSMSQSDTPLCDAAEFDPDWEATLQMAVPADFARRLERDRAKALEMLAYILEDTPLGIPRALSEDRKKIRDLLTELEAK